VWNSAKPVSQSISPKCHQCSFVRVEYPHLTKNYALWYQDPGNELAEVPLFTAE
jgi:hypothetical protein